MLPWALGLMLIVCLCVPPPTADAQSTPRSYRDRRVAIQAHDLYRQFGRCEVYNMHQGHRVFAFMCEGGRYEFEEQLGRFLDYLQFQTRNPWSVSAPWQRASPDPGRTLHFVAVNEDCEVLYRR
jgi:hypothetical protein